MGSPGEPAASTKAATISTVCRATSTSRSRMKRRSSGHSSPSRTRNGSATASAPGASSSAKRPARGGKRWRWTHPTRSSVPRSGWRSPPIASMTVGEVGRTLFLGGAGRLDEDEAPVLTERREEPLQNAVEPVDEGHAGRRVADDPRETAEAVAPQEAVAPGLDNFERRGAEQIPEGPLRVQHGVELLPGSQPFHDLPKIFAPRVSVGQMEAEEVAPRLQAAAKGSFTGSPGSPRRCSKSSSRAR